jgi:hypothetical protein
VHAVFAGQPHPLLELALALAEVPTADDALDEAAVELPELDDAPLVAAELTVEEAAVELPELDDALLVTVELTLDDEEVALLVDVAPLVLVEPWVALLVIGTMPPIPAFPGAPPLPLTACVVDVPLVAACPPPVSTKLFSKPRICAHARGATRHVAARARNAHARKRIRGLLSSRARRERRLPRRRRPSAPPPADGSASRRRTVPRRQEKR